MGFFFFLVGLWFLPLPASQTPGGTTDGDGAYLLRGLAHCGGADGSAANAIVSGGRAGGVLASHFARTADRPDTPSDVTRAGRAVMTAARVPCPACSRSVPNPFETVPYTVAHVSVCPTSGIMHVCHPYRGYGPRDASFMRPAAHTRDHQVAVWENDWLWTDFVPVDMGPQTKPCSRCDRLLPGDGLVRVSHGSGQHEHVCWACLVPVSP